MRMDFQCVYYTDDWLGNPPEESLIPAARGSNNALYIGVG